MRIFLIAIMFLSVISCGKENRSKKETLKGTEPITTETEENNSEELQDALGGLFNDEIVMEIDETVFVVDNGTNRANEDMSAGIMKMLAPQPYDAFKEKIMKEPEEQNGVTSLGVKETEIEGRKVLVQKSMTLDETGDKMIMIMYALPAGEKTIMISSYFMEKEESKYLPLIEKSVVTAQLKN
ncbi:hypothetical protein SAMN04487910_3064 [Aquimarina amphilecti]|uniref:DUF1795 domain-containing protein n=1 Tax=Aquimarina amphilecti TaxID=1038014 RepID=A0A1H7SCP4_AQUAM|nr:hypothetical protein [Aquimarina amphilecti]SEL69297.1 hypothetical protein SAMN04487910_3064 [Aquimarina amphilecti]